MWWMALVACGWVTPAPDAPAPAPHAVDAPAEVTEAVLHPELFADERTLVAELRETVTRCREQVVSRLDASEALTAVPSMGVEGVLAGCGPAQAVHDARTVAWIGRSRSLDWLLGRLARVGDDLDFLLRELKRGSGPTLANAIGHLDDATRQALDTADVVAETSQTSPIVDPALRVEPAQVPERWARLLESDAMDLGNLLVTYRQMAYLHGTDPSAVRRRTLAHYGTTTQTYVHAAGILRRAARVGGADIPGADAYLDAAGRLVAAYQAGAERYLGPSGIDAETREARWDALVEAHAAWQQAHAEALAAAR